MKKVLIISPYFPPTNAADMQRVRMSLPYYESFGWEPTIVTVAPKYADLVTDEILAESVPSHIKVHYVNAYPKKFTSKIGLGSIALRSLNFYKKYVNNLLKKEKFDLIFFSTTQFPLMILGAYWKRKFNIPYVIDMQDPWHTDYYQNKPKAERPPKYWFSYRLNKWLEPKAMKAVDGIISVSANYINDLQNRYDNLKYKPCAVITFGAFQEDFNLAEKHKEQLSLKFRVTTDNINLVYIGRGGHDMQKALNLLFSTFKLGLLQNETLFSRVKFIFIGTSYAANGQGIATILPIAQQNGVANYVVEETDRISFYESIANLKAADGLIILGSDQAAYTASKLYPYILAKKPLLAVFHPQSSVSKIMQECNAGTLMPFDLNVNQAFTIFNTYLQQIVDSQVPETNWDNFEPYTAKSLTAQQTYLFNQVINS